MPLWPNQRKPLVFGSVSVLTNWFARTGKAPSVANVAWTTPNMAVYLPIEVPEIMPRSEIGALFGSITAVIWDAGLYSVTDEGKPGVAIGRVGGYSPNNQVSVVPTRPALPPIPRGSYFLALVCSSSGETKRFALAAVDGLAVAAGVYTEANAYPLPEVATPSSIPVAVSLPTMFLVTL